MKKIIAALLVALLLPFFSFSQLTLQRLDGHRTIQFPIGDKIHVKLPTTSANENCDDCFQSYFGVLQQAEGDSLSIMLNSSERKYEKPLGLFRREYVFYTYNNGMAESVTLPKNLMSISKNTKPLPALGDALLLASIFNALVVGPIFMKDDRGFSDRISLVGFSTGLTLALLPRQKTYHFQNPKGKKRRLWKIAN